MKKMEAQQIFFPLGVLNAILAVGIWFIQDLHWFQTPALLIHSRLIAGGFLWSFITGFLMSAIPRLTGTSQANKFELGSGLLIIVATMLSAWSFDSRPFYVGTSALIAFLLIYLCRRLLKAKSKVSGSFLPVLTGLALALVGCWFHYQGHSFMGIHLFHIGAGLILVLGVGVKFSSFQLAQTRQWIFHAGGLLMAILLFIAGKGIAVAYLGLFCLSLFYLFVLWQVPHSFEKVFILKYPMRIAAVSIPLSFLMTWFQPLLYVNWFHLLFIGCFAIALFSLMTQVAVCISGGNSVDCKDFQGLYLSGISDHKKALCWVAGSLALGMISRLFYAFSEGMWRKSFLHTAGTFWFLAIGIWCCAFLINNFRSGPQSKTSS